MFWISAVTLFILRRDFMVNTIIAHGNKCRYLKDSLMLFQLISPSQIGLLHKPSTSLYTWLVSQAYTAMYCSPYPRVESWNHSEDSWLLWQQPSCNYTDELILLFKRLIYAFFIPGNAHYLVPFLPMYLPVSLLKSVLNHNTFIRSVSFYLSFTISSTIIPSLVFCPTQIFRAQIHHALLIILKGEHGCSGIPLIGSVPRRVITWW